MSNRLGRPRTDKRPERYDEAVKAVMDNTMSRKDAAKAYGINYVWFCRLFNRDYPDYRPKTDWQKKATREIGKANRRTVSWLEANIGDKELCDFIRSKGKCGDCPRNCMQHRRSKGLARVISEARVPLKDQSDTSEES